MCYLVQKGAMDNEEFAMLWSASEERKRARNEVDGWVA